jgi:hypothetical protein
MGSVKARPQMKKAKSVSVLRSRSNISEDDDDDDDDDIDPGRSSQFACRVGFMAQASATFRNRHARSPQMTPMGKQRRNSFQRSLSVGEDGKSSTFTSNITRRSHNFRASVARRSTGLARFTRHGTLEEDCAEAQASTQRSVYRGYCVGDSALISNHNSRWATCVNRFGYPPGEGNKPEEQRGPYIYVLGKVKIVHYEENAVFYTVLREDTGVNVRGDAGECTVVCLFTVLYCMIHVYNTFDC